MISVDNLLVETHRVRLNHDSIGNMVVLRANKRFMERAWREEAFASIVFYGVLSDECVSANEE